MDVEKYIALVEGRQAAMALETALQPTAKDLYSLGEAAGRVQGLKIALDLLNESLVEKPDGQATKSRPLVRGNPYTQGLDELPEQ